MSSLRRLLVFGALGLSLTQLAVECGVSYDPVRVGFVTVDGWLAVYVPMCRGDSLVDIAVHDRLRPMNGAGDSLVWMATSPRTLLAKQGFVVLGRSEDFGEVPRAWSGKPFPAEVDVDVRTAAGRFIASSGRTDDAPSHPAGAAPESMKFKVWIADQNTAVWDYARLRKEFFESTGICKSDSEV